ncbi:ribosomal protein S18-alanine N-acetyltransferase [Geoalkalibacter halelectricus]|uniref:[Ribosomal protein bS18]-alanine N-acetyltransferase n=1 Tax=Geoalkalibacter halelectricus TaxID=2847045 RepID=A0ABY5ZL34_9BACT|nr:ribosomal protein S18-alanine N-acetyltransferase [Geoalkalibacter halelectricus]MDO3376586.1 ribosomal protein S18-alanine N-acetyltransferase [Geoalkalibacter halelectricus]UWZ78454.1 ribosomal protein S18-alanine N-acetyltransferase [Geoalkalibacter halelectricus]
MSRADLAEVLEVEQAGYTHPWSAAMFLAELEKPQARIDLLRIEGHLAGYLCSWFLCGELHILNLVTAPAFRRQGVARRLLAHAIQCRRAQGLERVLLEVRLSNAPAIGLYEHFGFCRDAVRKGYYPDGEDAQLMSLSINQYPPRD